MKYAVVPQVYTIIAFGASLTEPSFLSRVAYDPSMEGMPYYLGQPFITWRFSLWLSTAVVWFIAFALSLRYIRKKSLKLTEAVGQNLHVISLATFTVIVALLGCVAYSPPLHFRPGSMRPDQPYLFPGIIALLGILFCIPAWIIVALRGYLSARWAKP